MGVVCPFCKNVWIIKFAGLCPMCGECSRGWVSPYGVADKRSGDPLGCGLMRIGSVAAAGVAQRGQPAGLPVQEQGRALGSVDSRQDGKIEKFFLHPRGKENAIPRAVEWRNEALSSEHLRCTARSPR